MGEPGLPMASGERATALRATAGLWGGWGERFPEIFRSTDRSPGKADISERSRAIVSA